LSGPRGGFPPIYVALCHTLHVVSFFAPPRLGPGRCNGVPHSTFPALFSLLNCRSFGSSPPCVLFPFLTGVAHFMILPLFAIYSEVICETFRDLPFSRILWGELPHPMVLPFLPSPRDQNYRALLSPGPPPPSPTLPGNFNPRFTPEVWKPISLPVVVFSWPLAPPFRVFVTLVAFSFCSVRSMLPFDSFFGLSFSVLCPGNVLFFWVLCYPLTFCVAPFFYSPFDSPLYPPFFFDKVSVIVFLRVFLPCPVGWCRCARTSSVVSMMSSFASMLKDRIVLDSLAVLEFYLFLSLFSSPSPACPLPILFSTFVNFSSFYLAL